MSQKLLVSELRLIPQRVQAGARYLAEHAPGFQDEIILDMLDQQSCLCCVIGQITGNYNISFVARKTSILCQVENGFLVEPRLEGSDEAFDYYDALTTEWRRVIEEMRHTFSDYAVAA